MGKASSGSLRLARSLLQSLASRTSLSQLRPASRLISSSSLLPSRTSRQCTASSSRPARLFSTTSARNADEPPRPKDGTSSIKEVLSGLGGGSTSTKPAASSGSLMEGLADLLPSSRDGDPSSASSAGGRGAASPLASALGGLDDFDRMKRDADHAMEEYHFAVYAHKHNTHVTVCKPNRDVIVSLSCGNLGFRKSKRGSYDAAYQLGAYVCDRLYQHNWHKTIQKMEVTLRGFGPGREAISKILLGNEGRQLRNKITRVADNTRLKFGGTRSKRKRRLG